MYFNSPFHRPAIAGVAFLLTMLNLAAAADPPAAREIRRFAGHRGPVNRLTLSIDGQYLATAGDDKFCYVLDAASFEQVRKYGPNQAALTGVAMMRDKSVIVASLHDDIERHSLVLWDWDTQAIRRKFADAEQPFWNLQLSPDESRFAVTLGKDVGAIRIYLMANGDRQALSGPGGGVRPTQAVAFAPSGEIVRMGVGGGSVRWQLIPTVKGAGRIQEEDRKITTALVYLPGGKQFLSGHADGAIHLFDDVEGTLLATFKSHTAEVTSLAVSKDGSLFASACADGSARVVNLKTRAIAKEWTAHAGGANSVVFLSAMELASCGRDGAVRAWSLDDKAPPIIIGVVPAKLAAPVPEQAQIAASISLLRDLFKEDYAAAKRPAEKVKLAEKLLGQSRDDKSAPAERYALLAEALRLSIEGASATAALHAGQEFSASFIQPADFRTQLATRLLATIQSTKDHTDVANAALAWSEESRLKRSFGEATQYAQLASRAAQKARSPALMQSVQEESDRVRRQQKHWETFQQAEKTLLANPADPAANLAAGLYYCSDRGDWARALPLLAKGSGPIQAAAAKEAAAARMPDQAIAIAEAWQAAGDTVEEDYRPYLHASAVYWYTKALPGLAGLQKIRVEQSIKKLATPGVQRK